MWPIVRCVVSPASVCRRWRATLGHERCARANLVATFVSWDAAMLRAVRQKNSGVVRLLARGVATPSDLDRPVEIVAPPLLIPSDAVRRSRAPAADDVAATPNPTPLHHVVAAICRWQSHQSRYSSAKLI